MASVIGIASEDSALAPVIGFLLCLVFLHVFSKRPFKQDDDSSLGIVLTYSLAFIFLSALLIKVNAQPQGDLEDQLFGILLVLLLIVGPGIIILDIVWSFLSSRIQKLNERRRQRALKEGIEVHKAVRKNSFVQGMGSLRDSTVIQYGADGDCKESTDDNSQISEAHGKIQRSLPDPFELIDTNGDGERLKDEVIAAAEHLKMTPKEAASFFDTVDVNSHRTIHRDQLTAASTVKNVAESCVAGAENVFSFRDFSSQSSIGASKSKALDSLFEVIDLDGDGELIKSEVVASAGLLGLTEEEAASLFEDMDENGSGKLTRDQFSANKFTDKVSVDISTFAESIASSLKSPSLAVVSHSGEAYVERRESKVSAEMFDEMFDFVDEEMQGSSRVQAGNSSVSSTVPSVKSAMNAKPSVDLTLVELFTKIDLNGDGVLDRSEVVAAAYLLGMSAEEAGNLFDRMDVDGGGTLTRSTFGATDFIENVSMQQSNLASDLSSYLVPSTLRSSVLARKKADQFSTKEKNSSLEDEGGFLRSSADMKRIAKAPSSTQEDSSSRDKSNGVKNIGTSI